MPALSFSGETIEGAFWELILRRMKTQTCREPRKRPIEKGHHLRLYWKQRVPKDKKPIHLIADATCIKVERMKYSDFAVDDDFARRDGFVDHVHLQQWFGDPETEGDTEYDVIHFRLLPRSLAEIIFQATEILKYWDMFPMLKKSGNFRFWEGYLKALEDVRQEVFTKTLQFKET